MSRRDKQSAEARDRERRSNRLRMAAKRLDPAYRDQVNARRKVRDSERKDIDPTLRPRLTANSLRHAKRKWSTDAEFRAKRQDYLRRWKHERFLDEAFEDFMARIYAEALEQ